MSRAGVREAIASYLNLQQIDYVGQVYPARPIILSEQDYENRMLNGAVSQITSANGSGCVLVVNLTEDDRQRRADTGRGAVNDSIIHSVVVELWFACNGDPENGANAQADYDNIVDGIFYAIRADATLGTGGQSPGSIWSAGEYAPFIRHQQSAPYTQNEGLTVFIRGHVSFGAWVWLAGNVAPVT